MSKAMAAIKDNGDAVAIVGFMAPHWAIVADQHGRLSRTDLTRLRLVDTWDWYSSWVSANFKAKAERRDQRLTRLKAAS